MKYLFPLLLLLPGCTSSPTGNNATARSKDTITQTFWEIQDGDTLSGSAVHVYGGDAIIENFRANPNVGTQK